jgi:Asp-tRNA(Asn)/Glu-tRNA(Gln) amidotransferase A subunit family amidase
MIRLNTQPNNSLKQIEARIKSIKNYKDLTALYQELIEKHNALDKTYKFTEAFDDDYVFYQLNEQYKNRPNSSLFAIPFGVKDIFNTKVLPTSMGSDIWRGFKSGNNARIVDEIFDRGGIIFSKTTTAEFAVHFITPEKTINPFNKDHITGTSSSGSAVAVASGALPVTLGTQTAGSILRPASFCGVYGFKPSFGAIDRTGVLKTNDTLDTIGLIGSDIYGIRKVFYDVLQKGKDYPFSNHYFTFHDKYKSKKTSDLKIGMITDSFKFYTNYGQYVKDDFDNAVTTLGKQFFIEEMKDIDFINSIHPLHEHIYSKSLSYYFQAEIQHYNSVSEVMRDMIERGEKIKTEDYIEAIKLQPVMRSKFDKIFEKYDFIITPSTASAAPPLHENELNDTCLIWTFLGYPAISIPLFFNTDLNLPFGLQIVAKKFEDFSLLDFSEKIEQSFR